MARIREFEPEAFHATDEYALSQAKAVFGSVLDGLKLTWIYLVPAAFRIKPPIVRQWTNCGLCRTPIVVGDVCRDDEGGITLLPNSGIWTQWYGGYGDCQGFFHHTYVTSSEPQPLPASDSAAWALAQTAFGNKVYSWNSPRIFLVPARYNIRKTVMDRAFQIVRAGEIIEDGGGGATLTPNSAIYFRIYGWNGSCTDYHRRVYITVETAQ